LGTDIIIQQSPLDAQIAKLKKL